MNAREAAFRSLLRIEKENRYSALELDSVISAEKPDDKEKALYTTLVYGVIERLITLDYIISIYSSKPVKRLDRNTSVILRLGVYQICMLDKIPDSAAVNECVKLAARYSARSKGFVNAILRKVASEKDRIDYPSEKDGAIRYLSVKYSLPEWICRSFCEDYPDEGEKIFEFVNSDPFITLRINTLQTSVIEAERAVGSAERCRYSPFGIKLTRHIPITDLSLDKGAYFVQDEASQIECIALDPKAGETVIDVCACPGGKSFSAAIEMKNTGKVYSFDIHDSKLPLIGKEAENLDISIIETRAHDSTEPASDLIGKADKVICDVPCSGLGVLHKKGDLRHKDVRSLETLPELQYRILCASAEYVKSGGIIVYSTCTLRKAENELVFNRFLEEHADDFELVPFTFGDEKCGGTITLLPHIHGTDGFFIAKAMKK